MELDLRGARITCPTILTSQPLYMTYSFLSFPNSNLEPLASNLSLLHRRVVAFRGANSLGEPFSDFFPVREMEFDHHLTKPRTLGSAGQSPLG